MFLLLHAIGSALGIVALVLISDAGGAGRAVIRHLTSKPLGSLAPGYASTWSGFRVYAAMIGVIGLVIVGFAESLAYPLIGAVLVVVGTITFMVLSVVAIRGEVWTYRALKR